MPLRKEGRPQALPAAGTRLQPGAEPLVVPTTRVSAGPYTLLWNTRVSPPDPPARRCAPSYRLGMLDHEDGLLPGSAGGTPREDGRGARAADEDPAGEHGHDGATETPTSE